MVAEWWTEYKEDQNPVHLAAIRRELPFLDHPQVDQDIAHLLLADFFRELDQLNNPADKTIAVFLKTSLKKK